MLKAVDLFAGCGGLSLGFQNAGFEIRAAFEYWETAAHCYELNFNHPVFRTDLSDVENAVRMISAYSPDLIIGGPPCQDFSFAGKRIEAERANLTEAFAKIISRIRPKYFVMENVDRAQQSNAFANAKKMYKDAGYGLTMTVLDASHCGVPQKRKRFFCIGIRNGNDDALMDILTSMISPHATTLREYYGNDLNFEYYYRHPRNYSRRAIFSIDEPAPTMRGVNRPVPKGYPGHPNDACPLSDNIRALTTTERALVQTFPKNFIWYGNKTDIEQMIGNAVPVKLAEFVATALLKYAEKSAPAKTSYEFIDWLLNFKHFTERSAKDVVSRCKRADAFIHAKGPTDAYYLFTLEQQDEFKKLSVNVRSQIKRALELKNEFLDSANT